MGGRADRDPEVTGEAHACTVAHQDARFEEALADERGAVTDPDEEEIGLGRWGGSAAGFQRIAQAGALGEDHGARALEVLLVLQGGRGGDLGETVDVVGGRAPG